MPCTREILFTFFLDFLRLILDGLNFLKFTVFHSLPKVKTIFLMFPFLGKTTSHQISTLKKRWTA